MSEPPKHYGTGRPCCPVLCVKSPLHLYLNAAASLLCVCVVLFHVVSVWLFKVCQRQLGHSLPLFKCLREPSQRLIKYQMLLKVSWWDSTSYAERTDVGVMVHFTLKSESEVAQSCPTLCDPIDCSLPGSSVHGIFQKRVLEWGAIAFSLFLFTQPQNLVVKIFWRFCGLPKYLKGFYFFQRLFYLS